MDNTNSTTEEIKNQDSLENVENTETKENKTDLPKLLREKLENANKKTAELTAKLQALEKAEEDKTKSAEEKLAEKDLKLKELENTLTKKEIQFNLEKKLIKENLNPEFQDLILSKASELVNDTTSIDEAVETIKSSYPSAFVVNQKNQSQSAGLEFQQQQAKTI